MNHKHTILFAIVWGSLPLAAAEPSQAIPFDQLGAAAERQSPDNGTGITATATGAKLKAVMQDLEAEATPDGLWLSSTADEDAGKPNRFRIRAMAVGREGKISACFDERGIVGVTPKLAVFQRSRLTEEYSVSSDGVRQDFLVRERPAGAGELSLELQVTGARAEAADFNVKLTVNGSGRELAYSRLKVTDATGRELAARMLVDTEDRLRIVVDDRIAIYPVRVDPTFSDADWVSFGQGPGTNYGDVNALVADGAGNIYVAGRFLIAGAPKTQNIAKWNGSEWSPLGAGLNGEVLALARNGMDLYASGGFSTAGGVPVAGIARWDGNAWSGLGSGLGGGYAFALVSDGSGLYAGGSFTNAGGIAANRVAKWNGVEWSALGSGIDEHAAGVYALAADGSGLYVGGTFYRAGGVIVNGLAKWSNNAWSSVGPLPTEGIRQVYALVENGSGLFVGGQAYLYGAMRGMVDKWDGSAWSTVGVSSSDIVYSIAVNGPDLYAGGTFYDMNGSGANRLAKWNGTTWSALGDGLSPPPFPETLSVKALATFDGNLYVGGRFVMAGGVICNNIAKWTGSAWSSPLGSGIGGSVSSLAAGGGNLYVGGNFSFTTATGAAAYNIAKWNGSAWSPLGSGINGTVYALATNGSDLYAGGSFYNQGNIAKWNGSQWSALGTGINGTVYALVASGSNLYAGGWFNGAGGVSVNNVAKWNGSQWSALATGVGRDDFYAPIVRALASDGTNLYVGGEFNRAGGLECRYLAKWSGTAWSTIGACSGLVHALTFYNGSLYVGGDFSIAGGNLASGYVIGGIPANGVARWDGANWNGFGSGIAPYGVRSIAVAGGNVYAAGGFVTMFGAPADRIAKWDGTSWSALGSGLDAQVESLAIIGEELCAGGSFSTAGGKPSASLAKAILQRTYGLSVEYPAGTALANGTGTVQFGTGTIGGGASRTFTLTNTGNVGLTGISASDNGADFAVSSTPPATLVVGGSAEFTVVFAPTATGTRNAVLTVSTNETTATPFTVALSGEGTTAQAAFSNIVGTSGLAGPDAAPSAIPFNDGVENLLKYAFNMNLAGPDNRGLIPGTGNSGLPSVGLTGTGTATMIRVEFLRRKGSGLVYTPKRSSTLEPGSFVPFDGTPVVTSIDDNWERVVVQESADPATLPASFAFVEVLLP